MARPRRLQFPGGHYHVISRGNARGPIYHDDIDRQTFLQLFGAIIKRLRWEVFAYCLMPNHYHLLVATPDPSLARGMQQLNGTYAQRFNGRHERVGHVFQGRYRAFLVDSGAYLLAVIRYIVLNPVRAQLCKSPDDWLWSSHAAAMGLTATNVPVAWDRVLAEFGPDPTMGIKEYAKFIAADDGTRPIGEFANPAIVGDELFTNLMSGRTKCESREIVRKERISRSLAAFSERAPSRNAAIRAAYQTGAYSLADIGRHFALHYSTVSKICRAPENADCPESDLFLECDENRQFKI